MVNELKGIYGRAISIQNRRRRKQRDRSGESCAGSLTRSSSMPLGKPSAVTSSTIGSLSLRNEAIRRDDAAGLLFTLQQQPRDATADVEKRNFAPVGIYHHQ